MTIIWATGNSASNFTHYQVQTPLIVYWPRKPASTVNYLTMVLNYALNNKLQICQNSPSDYSVAFEIY